MFLIRLCNLFLDIFYNFSFMKKRYVCEILIVILVWCGEKFIFWLNIKCSKVIVIVNNIVIFFILLIYYSSLGFVDFIWNNILFMFRF